MTAITISAKILDGNLGDGWSNDYAAAQALAEFTERQWTLDTAALRSAGNTVEITVDAVRNTSGVSAEPVISCDDDALDVDNSIITSRDVIWQRFCESAEAAELISRDDS